MKRVNFSPELEKRKSEIMADFHRPDGSNTSTVVSRKPEIEDQKEEASVSEETLKSRVIAALKTVYDPEIPVNIYDLGLIYNVSVKDRHVDIDMTLTTPGCPVAATFPGMVARSVELVSGVEQATVELVWEPAWSPDLISEEAKLELGLL